MRENEEVKQEKVEERIENDKEVKKKVIIRRKKFKERLRRRKRKKEEKEEEKIGSEEMKLKNEGV